MTTQQDERVAFEEEYRLMFPVSSADPKKFEQNGIGGYEDFQVNNAWRFWQARAALLEADAKGGEAVAWIDSRDLEALSSYSTQCQVVLHRFPKKAGVALYTRPQQAAQVPLTDEQAEQLRKQWMYGEDFRLGPFMAGLRAGEAAHGIGNDQ